MNSIIYNMQMPFQKRERDEASLSSALIESDRHSPVVFEQTDGFQIAVMACVCAHVYERKKEREEINPVWKR